MPSLSTEKPLTHEQERQHIIEENRRRMRELGLLEVDFLQPLRTPRKPPIRRASTNGESPRETRRSSRAAGRPKVDYKETPTKTDVGVERARGVRRPILRRGYISPAAKNEAAVRAGDIKTSHPSFVKAMLKSHTSGGFWLGLPSEFCTTNFTKDDIIVLEDEESLEWECVYLHQKHGLSGGWRGFSLDHDLEDGDAVVFELVTSSRFKVYITRAAGAGESVAEKTAGATKKRGYQYVVKNSRNVHVHSAIHKALKIEKGQQFDGRKCTPTKSAKTLQRNVRQSRSDWSSDDSLDSEDVLDDTSEDGRQDADGNTEESDQSVSSSDGEDRQPILKLKKKVSRPAKRSAKSKQQVKAKTEPKSLQINPGGKGSAKASMKVAKKDAFVRRSFHKTDMQLTKEMEAPQIAQESNLPPGTRLKPVGVCSIARGSMKRKLPSMFPARKYTYFHSAKSVKVH